MHKHLRAWRKKFGFTQERVGNTLEVAHTTVGRYESGEVTLSSKQIQALTRLYGITVGQLASPPEEAEMVRVLDEVQMIVTGMDVDALQHWLALGRSLKRPK